MNVFIKIIFQASRLILQIIKPMTIGVRVLLIREGCVLLVKHVYERKWYLPGGLVEKGETLEQAVRREAAEEVGAYLNEVRLFGVYSNFREGRPDHVITFLSEDFLLDGSNDHEIEASGFFPLDSLPEAMSLGSENRIREYREGKMNIVGPW